MDKLRLEIKAMDEVSSENFSALLRLQFRLGPPKKTSGSCLKVVKFRFFNVMLNFVGLVSFKLELWN